MTHPFTNPSTHSLNPAQRRAVEHDAGPLIVLAGPGTGKTRVIVHRIAHAIRERGLSPDSIVAVTFTIKAADELRARLASILSPSEADRVNAHTFHGFSMRLIQRFADRLGLPTKLQIIDKAQSRAITRQLITDLRLFPHVRGEGLQALVEKTERALAHLKNLGLLPDDIPRALDALSKLPPPNNDNLSTEPDDPRWTADLLRLYDHLSRETWPKGLLGFDDMILLPVRLLRRDPAVRDFCRQDYRAFVVDEFQDSNPAQLALLHALAGPIPGKLAPDVCVVGDDDQSIYGFRGADDQAFAAFRTLWSKGAAVDEVRLEENHRSGKAVIDVANAIITQSSQRFAPDKRTLEPADPALRKPPGLVECITTADDYQFGETIASILLTERAEGKTVAWGKHAVLCRTKLDAERVAAALDLEGIPHRVARATSFLEDPGVEDVLAWVEWLLEPQAHWSARRVLLRPPFSCDAQHVTALEKRYRAQRSVAEFDGETTPALSYATWLEQQTPASQSDAAPPAFRPTNDEDASPFRDDFDVVDAPPVSASTNPNDPRRAIARALRLYRDLQSRLPSLRGDDMILEIMRRIDAAHADLLPQRERAARVSSLLALLRLAREKQSRLAPPGDLAAFWHYFQELRDANELESIGTVDSNDPAQPDANTETNPAANSDDDDKVQILTAHSSKGLEFDTVFVVRVSPANGFPSTRSRDEWEPPHAIAALASPLHTEPASAITTPESTPDPKQSILDEERRLFYVACTRAERRLVLLAKATKKRSTSTHFFQELTFDHPTLVTTRTSDDVFRAAAHVGAGPLAGVISAASPDPAHHLEHALRARKHTDDTLDRARRRARLAAAMALDAANDPALDPESFQHITARLTRAAAELAAAARVATTSPLPDWLTRTDAAIVPFADALAAATRTLTPDQNSGLPALLIVPPKAPLKLSYSSVHDYHACPLCWYLRNVLGLPQRETDEITLGTVVHETLKLFYDTWRTADAEGLFTPDTNTLLDVGARTYKRSLGPSRPIEPAVLDQLYAQLRTCHESLHTPNDDILETEYTINFQYTPHAAGSSGGGGAPTGKKTRSSKPAPSIDPAPLSSTPVAHAFTAKIDRLDRHPAGGYRVIDYKTGIPKKAFREPAPDDLQMGIYLLALQAHERAAAQARAAESSPENESSQTPDGNLPGEAQYWCLATGDRGVIAFSDIDLSKVRAEIDAAIEGILAGRFPPADKCAGPCRLFLPLP